MILPGDVREFRAGNQFQIRIEISGFAWGSKSDVNLHHNYIKTCAL